MNFFMKSIPPSYLSVRNFAYRPASLKNILCLVLVIVLTFCAVQRNTVWLTESGLWGDVLVKAPKKARGYYSLGIVKKKSNRIEEAIEYYLMAIQLNPNYAEAHYNLGFAYGLLGRGDEDLEHTFKAVQLNPNFAGARFNLGVTYTERKLFSEAQREFEAVLRIDPAYPEARMFLNSVKQAQSRADSEP